MCLQPASQCFTPVLNNIVLSQSVDMSLQPASQSFTGVLQPTILQPRGHLLTASCWTSKSLGQFRGGGEGGGSTPCTPCTPCLTMLSLRSLMFTYTEGRPLSTRRETVTRTETRHPHRENRVPTPRDTFTHTKGKASPTQR